MSAAPSHGRCPGDDTITEFVEGCLNAEQVEALDVHLCACEACFDLVAASAGLSRGTHGLESESAEVSGIYERVVAGSAAQPRLAAPARSEARAVDANFELIEFIARGATSNVYRGRDPQNGRVVAIKRPRHDLARDDAGALAREAELLAILEHPNVVRLVGWVAGSAGGDLVLQYTGRTLRDSLREAPRGMPLERALRIALELCDGLARVHDLGIVHRDLKPENILLADDGSPLLADFGLASGGLEDELSTAGELVGTPAYMSPEAALRVPVDSRADLWAIGVLLFEMLTGRLPFRGADPGTVLRAIVQDPAPPLTPVAANAPPELADLIAQLLQKDRDRRIATARQLGARIENLLLSCRRRA